MARHFLTGEELSQDELGLLLRRAAELKQRRHSSRALEGKSAALIFQRPSTRTRVSAEVGIHELGGQPVVLRPDEMQFSRGESVRDTAQVLSRFVSLIGIRAGAHAGIEELAQYATVPVVNLLTEDHHPCQALADLMTLQERFGELAGLRLVYVGDGNNVANSLMILGAIAGINVVVAAPDEFSPKPVFVERARARAQRGAQIEITDDPLAAAVAADALYTDVWVSMGDQDGDLRRQVLQPYRIDEGLLKVAAPRAIVMHCLPAHIGEEISEGALYGRQSAVFDQAENRLHAQKALFELLVAAG